MLIVAKERFNGRDAGAVFEAAEADAEKWAGMNLCREATEEEAGEYEAEREARRKAAAGLTADPASPEGSAGASGGQGTEVSAEEIMAAAQMAVDAGDVTANGKPTVEAIEALLEKPITAAQRDEAWERMNADPAGEKEEE